jgi:hypothetical protein
MDISAVVGLFSDTSNYQTGLKFHVIILFIVILSILSKMWGSNTMGIFVILVIMFALYLINTYIQVTNDDLSDFNKTTFIKLQALQLKVDDHINKKIKLAGSNINLSDQLVLSEKNKLDSLYIDSTMINFLYSILPLYDYNPDEFYMLLKGTNNILKIRNQIEKYYTANSTKTKDKIKPNIVSFKDIQEPPQEPLYMENIHEMFEISIQLKVNCLNNIQNIIYGVPKVNKMYTYIDDVIERYSILISKNLKVINEYHLRAIREVGINTRTKFVYYKGTKGYDRMANQNIIISKDRSVRNELQSLYV